MPIQKALKLYQLEIKYEEQLVKASVLEKLVSDIPLPEKLLQCCLLALYSVQPRTT